MPAYVSSTVMRPMPNLENLKKQAKLYLRWHRDRYYPVAARIRAVLPSYRHLSDREVLAHSFRLSDAQELIARKAGFASWEALRKGVQTMTHTQAQTLSNTDLLKFLDASVSFYLGHGSTAGASYGADEAGAQATAQSERTKPVLVANRFHAISQASMMSARLRNTELASQWLRR